MYLYCLPIQQEHQQQKDSHWTSSYIQKQMKILQKKNKETNKKQDTCRIRLTYQIRSDR